MIKELIKRGFALKNNKRYKHAVEVFYKALEEENNSCELLYEIADSYFLMKNYERAVWYIEQTLKIEPAHIESMKLLKKIFISKKGYEQAEQTAKNIYAITSDIDDLAEIIKLKNIQGKYNEALGYDSENSPKIMFEQAKSLYCMNRKEEAINLLKKEYTNETTDQNALLFLGKLLFESDKFEEALNISKKIKIDRKNPDILNFFGLLELKQKNYREAKEYFHEAIKLLPENDEYFYNLANVYFDMGDSASSKKYYNLAISKNPQNKYYHYALAKLYYMEKRYKKALEELSGDLFESRLLKTIILCETGYLALAKREIAELIVIQPDNKNLLECKAKIENELGLHT